MKTKSALKQSIFAAKFLAVVLVIMVPVTIMWPNGFTFIILGISLFSFLGDVINVICIRHKAAQNPSDLDRKIK